MTRSVVTFFAESGQFPVFQDHRKANLKIVSTVNRQKRDFWLNVSYLVPVPPLPPTPWGVNIVDPTTGRGA
jgi:hypothetical protein